MAARLYYADYLTTPQNFISVVARLKDGVSLRQANAELGGDWVAVRRQRIDARHRVGRDRRAAPRSSGRSDGSTVRVGAARRGCVRAADRMRQRRWPAARAEPASAAARSRCASRSDPGRRRLVQQLLTEGLLMAVDRGRRAARCSPGGASASLRGPRRRSSRAAGTTTAPSASHGAPALDRRCAAVRARRRARHHAVVRARAGARGVAVGPGDGAQGGRPRRRPRQPHAFDARCQRGRARRVCCSPHPAC